MNREPAITSRPSGWMATAWASRSLDRSDTRTEPLLPNATSIDPSVPKRVICAKRRPVPSSVPKPAATSFPSGCCSSASAPDGAPAQERTLPSRPKSWSTEPSTAKRHNVAQDPAARATSAVSPATTSLPSGSATSA